MGALRLLVMGTVIEAKCSPLDAQTDGVLGEELSPDLPCVRCLDLGGGCTLQPFVPQGCVCAKPQGCSGSAPCQSYPGCRPLGPGGSGKGPKPSRPAGNRVPTGGQATKCSPPARPRPCREGSLEPWGQQP